MNAGPLDPCDEGLGRTRECAATVTRPTGAQVVRYGVAAAATGSVIVRRVPLPSEL
jgi:hypothetical protein